jgi:hypothetical protein
MRVALQQLASKRKALEAFGCDRESGRSNEMSKAFRQLLRDGCRRSQGCARVLRYEEDLTTP